jgi:hypothetical protein
MPDAVLNARPDREGVSNTFRSVAPRKKPLNVVKLPSVVAFERSAAAPCFEIEAAHGPY